MDEDRIYLMTKGPKNDWRGIKKGHALDIGCGMGRWAKRYQRLLIYSMLFIAAHFVSRHWFQLILIQGDSMHPAFHSMQLTVMDKRSRIYQTGDVIAFQCDRLDGVLVKRIAACPGDTVVITDGTMFVNGAVSAVYQETGIFQYAGTAAGKIRLPQGKYFVVGDNTSQSKDSRYEEIGLVDEISILGKLKE